MVFCIKVQKLHGVYRSVNNHKYLNTTHISIRSSTSFSLWPFLCKTEREIHQQRRDKEEVFRQAGREIFGISNLAKVNGCCWVWLCNALGFKERKEEMNWQTLLTLKLLMIELLAGGMVVVMMSTCQAGIYHVYFSWWTRGEFCR